MNILPLVLFLRTELKHTKHSLRGHQKTTVVEENYRIKIQKRKSIQKVKSDTWYVSFLMMLIFSKSSS